MKSITQLLKEGVVLGDGGYLIELERRGYVESGSRRERVGTGEEELNPPSTVETVGDLIAWLRERGEGYAHAFDKPAAVRTALDRVHARSDASIAGVKEVAFFPPMTGG